MTNLRFVVTGGSGAGKTAVLDALAVRGFRYVPDSARAIIKQRKEARAESTASARAIWEGDAASGHGAVS